MYLNANNSSDNKSTDNEENQKNEIDPSVIDINADSLDKNDNPDQREAKEVETDSNLQRK